MKIGFFTDWITRHKANFLAALAFALFAGLPSCSKENGGTPGGNKGDVPEGMVPVQLIVGADGVLQAGLAPTKAGETRTLSETAVEEFWMLQYDITASADGRLIHRQHISGDDIDQSGARVIASVMLKESAGSVIFVVANTGEDLSEENLPDGSTLPQLRTRTFDITSTHGTALPADDSAALPMTGETARTTISLIGSQTVKLNLTRLISRMGLVLVNNFTSGYPQLTLTSVGLFNAPNLINIGPLTSANDYLGTVFPPADKTHFINYEPVTTGLNAKETSFTWYIAPNKRGTGSASDPADKNALTAPAGQGSYCTYIRIEGNVVETAGATARPVKYTVYLGGNNTDDYNLWANSAYRAKLSITGFDGDNLEVGYDGFEVIVGGIDGTPDNTITGWHPDSGLEFAAEFTNFTPFLIDFGEAQPGTAQTVTFDVNANWRYTVSGNYDQAVAQASVPAGTTQTGGIQNQPAPGSVTFTPVSYTATEGTPYGGRIFQAELTFTTTDHEGPADTRTVAISRTVPTYYATPTANPPSGNIPRSGQTVTISLASNGKWSAAANPGTVASQEADTYATRTQTVRISSYNGWGTRQAKVIVQYGKQTKEFIYTQAGMSTTSASVSPDPSQGIPASGRNYTFTIDGNFDNIPIRIYSSGKTLAESFVTPGQSKDLFVPMNPINAARRTILFQYQENNVWKTIKSGTQAEQLQSDICVFDMGLDFYVACKYYYNYWAESVQYCESIGMRMPNIEELVQIFENKANIPDEYRSDFTKFSWSSTPGYDDAHAYQLQMDSGWYGPDGTKAVAAKRTWCIRNK